VARLVSTAGYIGKALFEAGLDEAGLDALLEASLKSDNARERVVAHGLIVTAFGERKEPWAGRLIAEAREDNWGDTALLTILRALPRSSRTARKRRGTQRLQPDGKNLRFDVRRKLARWAADSVSIIKELKPAQPPGFNNRLSPNWKLPLQIAQHAGGGWREQARRSAIHLSRTPYEPSTGVQLLAALRTMFAKGRTEIPSEQMVQEPSRRSRLAMARISWPRSNHQKPGGGIAERLRDPSCRRSSDQASRCLEARLQGSAIRGRVCAFLAPEPNIRTLKRGGGVKT